ncbi:MAG: phytoene/squalene synthase family protein [Pseudomonadota bacterium]
MSPSIETTPWERENFAYCEALLRAADKDRFLACLFVPRHARPGLYALYAFNVEAMRVRDVVSDPLPGEMRLQWWRDALEGNGHGDVQRHPVAAALMAAMGRHGLPVTALQNYLEARVFDLYDDAMPSLADLEGYAGETVSILMQLAALTIDPETANSAARAAGHCGVALAITHILRSFPKHAARGQVYLPLDVLEEHGVTREEVLSGQTGPRLSAALATLRAHAREHIDKARRELPDVHPNVAPALLPAALARPYLDKMEDDDYDPFRSVVDLPQWRRQWILWVSARRARRGAIGRR